MINNINPKFLILSLLLFFIIFAKCELEVKDLSCPLFQNDLTTYFDFPQKLEVGNQCFSTNQSTCCSEDFFNSLTLHEDPISVRLSNVLSLSDQIEEGKCQQAFDKLSCNHCSEYQQYYFHQSQTTGIPSIGVCSDMCDYLYESCLSENVNGEFYFGKEPEVGTELLVSNLFGNSWSFCHYFFEFSRSNEGTPGVPFYYLNLIPTNSDSSCLSIKPECTNSDYIASYGECTQPENTRNVFYYKSDSSECQPGLPLPSPLRDIRCDINCLPGTYLPIGSVSCKPCEEGTYSLGGGYRIDDWTEWPSTPLFDQYCINSSSHLNIKCPLEGSWTLNGTYISSTVHNDTESSVLETVIYFYPNGSIKFQYRVDGESSHDGLIFYIDDKIALNLVSNTLDWKTFETHIDEGLHHLRWIYKKDTSVSHGSDTALIRVIEFISTSYSDPSCISCLPGSYNDELGQSSCKSCEQNTISFYEGAHSCEPCNDTSYAYPGSSECLPRPDCVKEDYSFYYTECLDGKQREKKYYWLYPMICNNQTGVKLPNDENVDCAPCPPGTFNDETSCSFCETGWSTNITTQNNTIKKKNTEKQVCNQCKAGTKATKVLWYEEFDMNVWNSFETGCQGECGTNGWTLRENRLSSGTGHGVFADSYITTNITLKEPGSVSFKFFMACNKCHLEFFIDSLSQFSLYGAFYKGDAVAERFIETPGEHTLTWVYDHNDPYLQYRTDYVELLSVVVKGTDIGGGIECIKCEEGTWSDDGKDVCSLCEPGTSSEKGSSKCSQCSPNTFNPFEGGICIECGQGTSSQSGSEQCSTDCKFEYSGVKFDLMPLHEYQPIWPLIDGINREYNFSICSVLPPNSPCSESEYYSNSHICQVTTDGHFNLGSILGFSPNPDNVRSGLQVTFNLGTSSNCGKPRNTTIKLFCDPSADNDGIGSPSIPVEDPSCEYTINWKSLYACPLCSDKDYSYIISQCQNGKALQHYYWLENPVRCYGGSILPSDKNITCTENPNINCGPGQYLPPGSSKCKETDPGYYSIGPGDSYQDWNSTETLSAFTFENVPWIFKNGYIQSGVTPPIPFDFDDEDLSDPLNYKNSTSILQMKVNIVKSGEVKWVYQMYAPDVNDGVGFWFQVDDKRVDSMWRKTAPNIDHQWVTFGITLVAGEHVLRWIWSDPVGEEKYSGRDRGVRIKEIQVIGTKYAATNQVPCKPGTFTSNSSMTVCSDCPAQTFSTSGDSICTPCLPQTWSLPGSSECLEAHECDEEDFQKVFTECDENIERDMFYKLIEPSKCYILPTTIFPSNQTHLDCAECPPGTFRTNDGCESCDLGEFYENDGRCRVAPIGTSATPVKYYFFAPSTDTFPKEFKTSCSGLCGNNGWRVRENYIDSGYHGGRPIDSILSLSVEMVDDGYISFRYLVSGNDTDSGLEFLVDNEPISGVEYHPFVSYVENWKTQIVELKKGNHTIEWVYHQEDQLYFGNKTTEIREDDNSDNNDTDTDTDDHWDDDYGMVQIEEIFIVGEKTGAAQTYSDCPFGYYAQTSGLTACHPCPVGTYSNTLPSITCTPCPENHFTSQKGASVCEQCGNATVSSNDHSSCQVNDCLFNISEYYHANLSPLKTPFTIITDSRSLVVSLCSSNLSRTDCSNLETQKGVFDSHICEFHSNYEGGDGDQNTVNDVFYDYGTLMNLLNKGSALIDYMESNYEGKGFKSRKTSSTGTSQEDQVKWKEEEETFQLYFTSKNTDVRPCSIFETFITFNCNTTAAMSQSTTSSTPKWTYNYGTVCKIYLSVTSLYACPVCQDSDYEKVLSPCEDDTQRVSYIKSNPCFGDDIFFVSEQSCDDGSDSVSVSKISAGVAAGAFLLLTIILILVIYRNRVLAQKYDLLATHKVDELEMSSIRD